MADGRERGEGRWAELPRVLDAARRGSLGRVVALVRVGDAAEEEDAALVREVDTVARLVVLTGASLERLEAARGLFARPGRVRIESDEHAAVDVARAAVGVGDVLLAVSSRSGVLWDVMRTPLGSARRSA